MSTTAKKHLNKLANWLEKLAQGIVSALELVIGDLTGTKRRRTHVTYQRAPYQPKPVVIVKVIRERK